MRQAHRFDFPGGPYEGLTRVGSRGVDWSGRVQLAPDHVLKEPLGWKKPQRVFVDSMSDLFHEALPNEAIERVFGVMALAPQHTFQILTKRPARMREWFASGAPGMETREEDVQRQAEWRGNVIFDSRGSDRHLYPPRAGDVSNRRPWPGWPLPNVWLGVSVEDQATADERIPLLLQTPAAVRFVSYEPALGPVDFRWGGMSLPEYAPHRPLPKLDWLIVGGESGPGARPFDVAWARSAVRQCREAGVACFVKQLGARPFDSAIMLPTADGGRAVLGIYSPKGGDPAEWSHDLRVREFPA
jgi:protein gp37